MKSLFLNKEIALFYIGILCFSFLWMNRVEVMEEVSIDDNVLVYDISK